MTPLAFVVEGLAAYRLTKLVVDDQLTAEPRDAVIRWAYDRAPARPNVPAPAIHVTTPGSMVDVVAEDDDPPKLAFLVTCPWCAGMWVSLGLMVVRRVAPRAWAPLAEALALSAVAGLVAENLQHS